MLSDMLLQNDLTQLNWLVDMSLRVAPIELDQPANYINDRKSERSTTSCKHARRSMSQRRLSKKPLSKHDHLLDDLLHEAIQKTDKCNQHSVTSLVGFALLSNGASQSYPGMTINRISRWINRHFSQLNLKDIDLKVS